MDNVKDSLRKLRAIMARTGMKQHAIAERVGVAQGTISRWLVKNPKFKPSRDNIEAIKDLFEEVFPDDVSEAPTKNHAWAPTQQSGDVQNLTIHSGAGGGGLLSVEYDTDGDLVDPAMANGFWSFPDSIKAGWGNLSSIKAMPVIGDSMEPTISKGSTVFIDTTHTHPSPEDIYAVDYGDGLVIKRLKLVPRSKKILVISDNRERYGEPDELNREEISVYGRVVAWFQWRG